MTVAIELGTLLKRLDLSQPTTPIVFTGAGKVGCVSYFMRPYLSTSAMRLLYIFIKNAVIKLMLR